MDAAIKKELEREPEQSNRSIAAKLQANDKRVGEIRAQLETRGAIPHVTHTTAIPSAVEAL